MTLTEFLLARIEADESFALSAQAEASIYDEPRWHWLVAHSGGSRWHPTLHDPARVLAECEAKRRIVEDVHFDGRSGEHIEPWCACCSDDEDLVYLPCETLRHLAAVYADHPDYRDEWRLARDTI